MCKVIWTEKASAHLKAIHDYIAEDSSVYAMRFIKSLAKVTAKLELFAAAGRSVPNSKEPPYGLTPDQDAEIITVAHGREDLVNNLNKDWIL